MEGEGSSSKTLLIGVIVLLILVIIGAIFWLNYAPNISENKFNENSPLEEESFVDITSGGCDELGLAVASEPSYSCFDKENHLVKLY
ncbi:MAG: hypothetical protein WCI72_06220, partial [archaeon]